MSLSAPELAEPLPALVLFVPDHFTFSGVPSHETVEHMTLAARTDDAREDVAFFIDLMVGGVHDLGAMGAGDIDVRTDVIFRIAVPCPDAFLPFAALDLVRI